MLMNRLLKSNESGRVYLAEPPGFGSKGDEWEYERGEEGDKCVIWGHIDERWIGRELKYYGGENLNYAMTDTSTSQINLA